MIYRDLGVSENEWFHLGGPCNEDYRTLGFMLWHPVFANLQILGDCLSLFELQAACVRSQQDLWDIDS